uniref:Uncharacterized protein n=1 Tax=Globodera pallida TaxID=36090 RepID=A0A183CEK7_GLOPA
MTHYAKRGGGIKRRGECSSDSGQSYGPAPNIGHAFSTTINYLTLTVNNTNYQIESGAGPDPAQTGSCAGPDPAQEDPESVEKSRHFKKHEKENANEGGQQIKENGRSFRFVLKGGCQRESVEKSRHFKKHEKENANEGGQQIKENGRSFRFVLKGGCQRVISQIQ